MVKEATPTSDRECQTVKDCKEPGIDEFTVVPPTATSDRVCATVSSCGTIGETYESVSPTESSDRECANVTVCGDIGVQWTVSPATIDSDTVCADVSGPCDESEDEFSAPTATSDRECAPAASDDDDFLSQGSQGFDDRDTSASTTPAAAAAAVALVALVVLAAKYHRSRPKREGQDGQALMAASNAAFVKPAPRSTAATKLMPFTAVGGRAVSELTQRGDRLWLDFRKCTSFDTLYFGNKLFKLNDTPLPDTYAITSTPCPPQGHLRTLRGVGAAFGDQKVDTAADAVIDDLIDFLASGMPDMLVERGLDMAPVLEANPDVSDEEVYECFYAMIDDYMPERNQYLSPSGAGCRGLASNAAARSLNLVDAIYYEINKEEESTYSAINADPTYAGGTADTTYGMANYKSTPGKEKVYDSANLSDPLEATYAMGASDLAKTLSRRSGGNRQSYLDVMNKAGAIVYDSGRPATIYDIGSASAASEPVYSVGASATGREPIYSMGDDATLRRDDAVDDAVYSMGNGEANEAEYSTATELRAPRESLKSFAENEYSLGTEQASGRESTYDVATSPVAAAPASTGDMYTIASPENDSSSM